MASTHQAGEDSRVDKLVREHGNSKENTPGVGIAGEGVDGSKPVQPSKQVRNSKGWDGKLRVDRKALRSVRSGRDDGVEDEGRGEGHSDGEGDGSDGEEEDDDDDDDDDDSSGDEAVGGGGGGAATATVPAETGLEKRRVEVKDGEEIEADEDLLEDLEEDADEIDLVHCRISSIPSLRLERFKAVEKLCLRQNAITKPIFPTSLGPSLRELDLYDNLISKLDGPNLDTTANGSENSNNDSANDNSKLSGLEALVELTSLDLSFNKIKRIRNLSHLTKLRELYCVQNKISKIEGLEKLKDLRCLELGANRIRTIENLDSMTSLNELWLGKNKITELKGISTLRNLTILSIQSNRLTSLGITNSSSNRMPSNTTNDQTRDGSRTDTDIVNEAASEAVTNNTNNNVIDNNDNNNISNLPLPLSFLTSLTELHVSHNALTSLNGLSAGPASLRILDISSNPLSSLAGIESLTNLEELWASNCHMDDWREVERGIGTEKSGKHALETVYLEGNPIQRKQPALYRGKVKLLVPGVRQIDASFVRV